MTIFIHVHAPTPSPIGDQRSAQQMSLVPTSQKEFPKWDQISVIKIHALAPLIG